jgi:hypothetical protein
MQLLFSAQTTNANSPAVQLNGGEIEVVVAGTLGGGTVTIEAFYPVINAWVPLDGGSFTAASVRVLKTVRPCQVRAVLSGATGASLTVGV